MTRSTAEAAQRLFINECDFAYNKVMSGATSYSQAVREAVETVTSGGVYVDYPSGHRDTIEVATARAVRTGIAQAAGDISIKRMEEMDWDIILVSAHIGARTGAVSYTHLRRTCKNLPFAHILQNARNRLTIPA